MDNRFVHGKIREELTAQQIFFPATRSPGLRAKEFPELQPYAGTQVVDGFIGRHLAAVGGGRWPVAGGRWQDVIAGEQRSAEHPH